jgi:hypothetical protein
MSTKESLIISLPEIGATAATWRAPSFDSNECLEIPHVWQLLRSSFLLALLHLNNVLSFASGSIVPVPVYPSFCFSLYFGSERLFGPLFSIHTTKSPASVHH